MAARSDYKDRVTGKLIPAVTTGQIYKGSIAFIFLQLIMVGLLVFYPELVTGGIQKVKKVNEAQVMDMLNIDTKGYGNKEAPDAAALFGIDPKSVDKPADDDPMKALLESLKKP